MKKKSAAKGRETLVVGSKVKGYIKTKKFKCSGELVEALIGAARESPEREICGLIDIMQGGADVQRPTEPMNTGDGLGGHRARAPCDCGEQRRIGSCQTQEYIAAVGAGVDGGPTPMELRGGHAQQRRSHLEAVGADQQHRLASVQGACGGPCHTHAEITVSLTRDRKV